MSWLTRSATALVLALAVGAVPVVLDYCAASCAAHQAATRNGAQPACHHVTASGPRIGETRGPLGHDHHGMTATAASNPIAPERSAGSVLVALSIPPHGDSGVTPRIDCWGGPPGLLATPHDRSLPLRI